MDDMSTLITAVKKKQELRHLSTQYIVRVATEHKRLHPKVTFDALVKAVRAKARPYYGIYHQRVLQREELLAQKEFKALLTTHKSTQERLDDYAQLYTTFQPDIANKRIIDIGCGFNPLSIVFAPYSIQHYHACDFCEEDMDFIHRCLDVLKQSHQVTTLDVIHDWNVLSTLAFADTAFLFKVVDVFEQQKRFITYDLLPAIQAHVLLVSFSRTNIRGKTLTMQRRMWFEKACDRLAYTYEHVIIGQEWFYRVLKNSNKSI
ncbi:MAG: hypothetical protein ACMXYC_02260 [Candidatus Woesearchaeota archaeon]